MKIGECFTSAIVDIISSITICGSQGFMMKERKKKLGLGINMSKNSWEQFAGGEYFMVVQFKGV